MSQIFAMHLIQSLLQEDCLTLSESSLQVSLALWQKISPALTEASLKV